MKYIGILLLCVSMSACGLTAEQRVEVRDGCGIGTQVLKDWDKKDDATKKKFFFAFVRILHNIRFTVDGDPVPEEYTK